MIFKRASELKDKSISFCMISLIGIRGSAPQDLGAKCLVTMDGLDTATIGGGKIEATAIRFAQELLLNEEQKDPKVVKWNLQTDIGMTCGGEVTLLFEHFPANNWPIAIFGAGHVSQALCRTLSNLNCQVTCIDPRIAWVEKLEGVKAICHPEPAQLIQEMHANTFFISINKGNADDVPVLAEIAKRFPTPKYVGVIGSEIKGARIKKKLINLGVSQDFLEQLRVPIGLSIGTNDPYEIAISIVAELLQVRGRC
jgi:xanthine dehydrogenase accessory factor